MTRNNQAGPARPRARSRKNPGPRRIPPLLMRDVLSQCQAGATIRNAFLHIPKTGGTSVGEILSARRNGGAVSPLRLRHEWTLQMFDAAMPEDARLHFVLRDPIERFASAFYSRKRKGYPAFNADWRPEEARVFERFPDVSSLFRAVASAGATEREEAALAFRSIRHLKRGYAFYFGSPGLIDRFKNRIGLVGTLEKLDDFCAALLDEVDGGVRPSTGLTVPHAHRAPSAQSGHDLDEKELEALRAAFEKEYKVFNHLQQLINT